MVQTCEGCRQSSGSSRSAEKSHSQGSVSAGAGASVKAALQPFFAGQVTIPEGVSAYRRSRPENSGWSGDWSGNFNNRDWNNYVH
jgi:hypothetical protein